jgi:hypothetical protein
MPARISFYNLTIMPSIKIAGAKPLTQPQPASSDVKEPKRPRLQLVRQGLRP